MLQQRRAQPIGFAGLIVATSFALLLAPTQASAVPRLDFDINSGGLVTYAGGDNPLQGANIGVSSLVGSGGANDGVSRSIVNGVLSFTTGDYLGTGPAGLGWLFGTGGTIALRGAIPSLGIGAGSTLFSGTFQASPLTGAGALVVPTILGFNVSIALFGASIPSAVTNFWGLTQGPGNIWTGNFVIAGIGNIGSPGTAFNSYVLGGSGSLEALAPEPSSWLLMGSALFTIARVVRRKRGMAA